MTPPSATVEAPETVAARAPERTRSERCDLPPTDIYETADAIIVVADMPGVGESGVSVELEGKTLTLSGTAGTGARDTRDAARCEYRPGVYERAFTLSDAIERGKITASMKDGVLTLVLPKAEPVTAETRKVEVRGG